MSTTSPPAGIGLKLKFSPNIGAREVPLSVKQDAPAAPLGKPKDAIDFLSENKINGCKESTN
jgi:hypothetical protein